jgi:hypothetical protein
MARLIYSMFMALDCYTHDEYGSEEEEHAHGDQSTQAASPNAK